MKVYYNSLNVMTSVTDEKTKETYFVPSKAIVELPKNITNLPTGVIEIVKPVK